MIEPRPRLRLVVDNNVPADVAVVFAERGHELFLVASGLTPTAPDEAVAELANRLGAIVLTWDKDFERIISRAAIGTRQLYRHAGRISFVSIPYRLGRRRAEDVIDLIEFEFGQLRTRRDKRRIISVWTHRIVLER